LLNEQAAKPAPERVDGACIPDWAVSPDSTDAARSWEINSLPGRWLDSTTLGAQRSSALPVVGPSSERTRPLTGLGLGCRLWWRRRIRRNDWRSTNAVAESGAADRAPLL